jgi:hypothetical protein
MPRMLDVYWYTYQESGDLQIYQDLLSGIQALITERGSCQEKIIGIGCVVEYDTVDMDRI